MPSRRDLQDNASSAIRRLQPRDLPLVVDHLLRLEEATLCDRFGFVASAAYVRAYVDRLPLDRGVLAGSFPDDQLRGLAEARPVQAGSSHWEAVITVEPRWQRKGLGRTLADSLLHHAARSGATRVYFRCSTSNAAGQHFLARLGGTLREDDGDAVAAIDLTDPAVETGAMLRALARQRAGGPSAVRG